MKQTKNIIIVVLVFLACLAIVVYFNNSRQSKTAPILSVGQTTVTTSSSPLSLSFVFPSPPTVQSNIFPDTISTPTELPLYQITGLSENETDARIFRLLTSLSLASPSSRIKQNGSYSYQWQTDGASASYTRKNLTETLSYQQAKRATSASPSGTIEKDASAFLLHINPSLPTELSWKNIETQTSGFEGLLLDDPAVVLRGFTYGLMFQNVYPLVFPNQMTQAARVIVDGQGAIRSFSGFLVNFSFTPLSSTPLISYKELQRRINAREAPLIGMTEKTIEPGDSSPSFSKFTVDEIVSAYFIDEKNLRLIPCFLVSGDTNENGVRLTYLVSALP